jgi:nucleoside 2-deoxyribosyltransferase
VLEREKEISMNSYDYYAAGPFFNSEQILSMQGMEKVLFGHHATVFRPRFASDIAVVGPNQCFLDDCAGIRASRCLIANLIDDDPGTMFEIGYAIALGKQVYAYKEGCQPGDKVNLMIAESVKELFVSAGDLDEFLSRGQHTRIQVKEY